MKTLFKIAALNSKKSPILHDYILFKDNQAFANHNNHDSSITGCISGDWFFDKPALVPISLVKKALLLNKKPVWVNNTLNGIALLHDTSVNISDYPAILTFDHGTKLEFTDINSLQKILPAMGNNDSRYYLNGLCLYLNTGDAIATDGHRLHIVENAFNPPVHDLKEAIIPRSVFDIVKPGSISVNNTHALIVHDSGWIIANLIDAKYPGYKIARVMPAIKDRPIAKNFNGAQSDTLKKALAIHKANSKDKFHGIVIEKTGNMDVCDMSLPFFDTGLPYYYGINCKYLLDAFASAEHGQAFFPQYNTDSILISDGGNFKAVVMPMRLQYTK